MGSTTSEFRVFVSSTFRDLQDEREYLVKKIFPEIRDLCRKRGIVFTEVDLRWGLRHEESEYGTVIRTCLDEIDRCRPYFIGITGERYGYVPTYTEIYKDPELLRRYPWIEDAVLDASSIVDLEFRYGALDRPDDASRVKFFLGRARRSLEQEEAGEDRKRLESLKDRVRSSGLPFEDFRDPVSLGEAVYDHLIEIIEKDFSETRPPTPLDIERARHAGFAASRRHAYIPNPNYLRALSAFVEGRLDDESRKLIGEQRVDGDEENALVVYAESGSGKSALLAYWAEQYRRRNPDAFLVEHYVGVGAGAADHIAILRHIVMEIAERFGVEEEIPASGDKLIDDFPRWLGYARGERLILLVDGVNQLQGPALTMAWLPEHFPPNVSLVITTTVEQTLVTLRSRGWMQLGVQPLTVEEREAIIVRFLSEYHKAMPVELLREVANDVKCAHPLFLRTLLEEIRMFGRHEHLDREVRRYLRATGTEDLFQIVLERIEEDFGVRTVRDALTLLWASRAGLAESELVEITGASRLKLTALMRGLDYHLVSGGGLLSFFHDYLRRAVEKRYLAEELHRRDEHLRLGRYFAGLEPSARVADELPWQLNEAQAWSDLRDALTDDRLLEFMMKDHRQYRLLIYWRALEGKYDAAASYRDRIALLQRESVPISRRLNAMKNAAGYLLLAEHWVPAEEILRTTLREVESVHGGDSEGAASTLTELASVLGHVGRYEEAEALVRRAIDIRERLFGTDSPDAGDSLGILGWLYFEQQRYAEAEPIFRRRLEIDVKAHGISGPRFCNDANNLASQLWNLNRFDEADALYEQARVVSENTLGPDHPQLAQIINNHAVMLGRRANVEKTERDPRIVEYLERALYIRRRWFGPNHSETSTALNNLGSLMLDLGRFDEALQLLTDRTFVDNVLPERTAVVYGYLGRARMSVGDLAGALSSQRSAYALLRTARGNVDLPLSVCLSRITQLLADTGRHEEARAFAREALDLVLGQPDANPALVNVMRVTHAYSLRRLGDIQAARTEIDLAIPSLDDSMSPELHQRAHTERSLILLATGATPEAMEEAALACGFETNLTVPRSAILRGNAEIALAGALLAAGEPAEAEPHVLTAIRMFERFAGPRHPDTVEARALLADVARARARAAAGSVSN